MPRFIVERTFPDGGVAIPVSAQGAQAVQTLIGANAQAGVTWIHSYVTPDKKKTFCVYEGPNQAIRRAAAQTGMPVDRITEVRGFDPYFYL